MGHKFDCDLNWDMGGHIECTCQRSDGVRIPQPQMPLPKGMSQGFYAFMRPGCPINDSGEAFMNREEKDEQDKKGRMDKGF